MEITEKISQSLERYKKALLDFAKADTECEGEKKLFEIKLSTMIVEASGSSQAEKERNAKVSTEYEVELRKYLNKIHTYNIAKAKMKGAEAEFETERSKLSYEKALIEKGIIS